MAASFPARTDAFDSGNGVSTLEGPRRKFQGS